jgi:hypothetical protein
LGIGTETVVEDWNVVVAVVVAEVDVAAGRTPWIVKDGGRGGGWVEGSSWMNVDDDDHHYYYYYSNRDRRRQGEGLVNSSRDCNSLEKKKEEKNWKVSTWWATQKGPPRGSGLDMICC